MGEAAFSHSKMPGGKAQLKKLHKSFFNKQGARHN